MKRTIRSAAVLPGLLAAVLIAPGFAGCASNDGLRSTPEPKRAAAINLKLAVDYMRRGNLVEAKEKIDRALDQDPDNARSWSFAGMLYDRLDEDDKADSYFRRAVSIEPDDPEIRNNYAVHLCQHDKFERGEEHALRAAQNRLYRTPEVAYLNAGNCARGRGDLKRAEQNYRLALRVQPRFAAALLAMADMEYGQEQFMSARAFLQRYMEVGRTTPETLWLAHQIEHSLGNANEAQHYARRLKSEYPKSAQTKELLESERNPG